MNDNIGSQDNPLGWMMVFIGSVIALGSGLSWLYFHLPEHNYPWLGWALWIRNIAETTSDNFSRLDPSLQLFTFGIAALLLGAFLVYIGRSPGPKDPYKTPGNWN